jgi:hypothetical protein
VFVGVAERLTDLGGETIVRKVATAVFLTNLAAHDADEVRDGDGVRREISGERMRR